MESSAATSTSPAARVTLVARGAHLDAIRSGGWCSTPATGGTASRRAATDTAAEVGWTDDTVVVLAVKSHQAAVALADLRGTPPPAPVVCATNGIATEAAAPATLRRGRTPSASCCRPRTSSPAWSVAGCHPTPAILDIGRIPGGTDATTAAVSADLHAAGIASEERDDIMAWSAASC